MRDRAKTGRGAPGAAAATAFLQSAYERLPVGFALFDAKYRLVAASARFGAHRGYPRRLLKTGTPLESFVRFDAERGEYGAGTVDAVTRTRLAALKRGRPAEREAAHAGGRIVRIACERLPEGGLALTCEDVTELKKRERQLAEQTAGEAAVRELLEAMSRSAFDLEAVLRTLVESAARLCGAEKGFIFRLEGDTYRLAVDCGGVTPEFREFEAQHPMRPERGTLVGRTALEKRAVHIEDILADREYRLRESQRLGGFRTILGVPIMRDDVVIGVLALWKERVEPFKPAQIQLVTTFSSQASIAIENVRLFNETKEALEQQTATSEILRAIAGSPTDLQPILDTVVRNAARLCEASNASLFRVEGDSMRLVARNGVPTTLAIGETRPIARGSMSGRAILDRQTVNVPDFLATDLATEFPDIRDAVESRGLRSCLAAPLVLEGVPIGALTVYRTEVRPFSDKQLELVKIFADQAVIAIQNVRLFNETKEALEQQTATAEILKVISASPTDVQPVFEAIVQSGVRLFENAAVSVVRPQAGQVCLMAVAESDPGRAELWRTRFPFPLSPEYMHGVAILDGRLVDVPDVLEAAGGFEVGKQRLAPTGYRAMTVAPMLRDNVAIGAISVIRVAPGPLSDKQVVLLKTFADQAVIAIENVRLFNETKEALERQTATAEILKVISSSPTDVQPVFDAIAESGVRLFQGVAVSLRLIRGERIERVAFAAAPGCEVAEDATNAALPLGDRSFAGRAVLRRELVHVPDIPAADWVGETSRTANERMGVRAIAVAPMLRDNKVLGVVAVTRAKAGSFSDRELALLTTFADQAVIAIENARLFNETKEALDHQKASAEVLQVISSSVADTQPVFDKILESSERLFEGRRLGICQVGEDGAIHLKAYRGPNRDELMRHFPVPLSHESGNGTAILQGRLIHYSDTQAPDVPDYARRGSSIGGNRSALFVPMLWEGRGIGSMFVARANVGEFPEKEIALLKTFADQAVIAIQNARLFNETKEALERQTATAEILRVISSSPTDISPVLDAVAENAARLCDAHDVVIMMNEGDVLRAVKSSGSFGERFGTDFTIPITRGSAAGRAVVERATIRVTNFALEPEEEYPVGRAHRRIYGDHGVMATPLLRGGAVLGVIAVLRRDVRPFSDRQSALLQTFADQAAIAIANVRLFNETKEALDHQKASAEVLQVISSSVADTKPVFEKILESCEHLFEGRNVGVALVSENGEILVTAYHGPGGEEFAHFPVPLSEASGAGSAILHRRVMHYPDTQAPEVPDYARRGSRLRGDKALVIAPMLWEGRGVGVIFVGRATVGEFSEKEIALLKTFADQAVIAIQNARLFNEIREKSHQLEIANQHKSAFLANMSHELRTPLNAVIGFSEMLAARYFGNLTDKQAEYVGDIHASGKHLLSLINDILDLSKIEAGRMELEEGEFDLRAALDNALTLVRERAQRSGVALRLETDPALGAFRGDERKLKQVVLNLLSNAVKFTPRGGAVGVVARQANGSAEIAVSDTGVGIAAQDQEAIFEAFRQVGTDVTRKREGTGLGLALTRRFVELHGGTIRVESEPGKGSTFTVTLPLGHGE